VLLRGLIVESIEGFGVETIRRGVNELKISCVDLTAGLLAKIFAQNALDEGGARDLRSDGAIDSGEDFR
jgi:hypothetical protein